MPAIPDYNYPTPKVERHLKVCQVKAKSVRPSKTKRKKLTREQQQFAAQQITDREVANKLRYILREQR